MIRTLVSRLDPRGDRTGTAGDGARPPGGVPRTDPALPGSFPALTDPSPPPAWSRLRRLARSPSYGPKARVRLISCRPSDPAALAFEHLRGHLLRSLPGNRMARIAVIAPTPDCGSTFATANLALSLSRISAFRTLALDLNLPRPGLAKAFDIRGAGALEDMLTGAHAPEKHLFRIGETLALGLNDRPVANASALMQGDAMWDVLDGIQNTLSPDITLIDLPPLLRDDTTRLVLPMVDGVLLVADGAHTTSRQIAECERRLSDRAPLLGVVLNRAAEGP